MAEKGLSANHLPNKSGLGSKLPERRDLNPLLL
jgi:hypothetical protein